MCFALLSRCAHPGKVYDAPAYFDGSYVSHIKHSRRYQHIRLWERMYLSTNLLRDTFVKT